MPQSSLSPRQLTEKGLKAYQAQDYPGAIGFFTQASSGFQASGDVLSEAETANNMSLCYLKSGDAQTAYDLVKGTDEVFSQGNDPHRQAIALANQASALEGLHKFDNALEKYEQSSRLLKETGNQEERVFVLKALSELHMKMGHQLDAMATMQIALINKKNPSALERFLKKLLQIPFRT